MTSSGCIALKPNATCHKDYFMQSPAHPQCVSTHKVPGLFQKPSASEGRSDNLKLAVELTCKCSTQVSSRTRFKIFPFLSTVLEFSTSLKCFGWFGQGLFLIVKSCSSRLIDDIRIVRGM